MGQKSVGVDRNRLGCLLSVLKERDRWCSRGKGRVGVSY
jgi:hypothetical protein